MSTSISVQCTASADDAFEQGDSTFNYTDVHVKIYSNTSTSSANYRGGGFRFPSVSVPNAAIITAATLSLYANQDPYINLNVDVYFHNVDNAPNFATLASILNATNRPRTTATTAWVALGVTQPAWTVSPSIISIVQEIVNRAGWASEQAMVALLIPKTNANYTYRCEAVDAAAGQPAKLDITYTTGRVPLMANHYRRLRC